jgi:hypothetical protein
MKKVLTTTFLGLILINISSQINWQKGGNSQTPPLALPTIGTDGSWNAPFRFLTFGQERMRINENTNYNAGYFGTGFFYPAWLATNFPSYTAFNPNGFVGIKLILLHQDLDFTYQEIRFVHPAQERVGDHG